MNGDCADHDKCKRWVPIFIEGEKSDDLVGIGHTRYSQSQSENKSTKQREKGVHSELPAKSVAIRNPEAIKEMVATIDRVESFEIPHTPCPLVHPEPILVPIPTRRPAKTSVDKFLGIAT